MNNIAATIICITWQSSVMPVPTFCVCHASCYDAEQDRRSNKEVRPVAAEEMAVSATCDCCGKAFV